MTRFGYLRATQRRGHEVGMGMTDLVAALIILFLLVTAGKQTYSSLTIDEEEQNKKALVCLKEFQEQDCNPFASSEKCFPIL